MGHAEGMRLKESCSLQVPVREALWVVDRPSRQLSWKAIAFVVVAPELRGILLDSITPRIWCQIDLHRDCLSLKSYIVSRRCDR